MAGLDRAVLPPGTRVQVFNPGPLLMGVVVADPGGKTVVVDFDNGERGRPLVSLLKVIAAERNLGPQGQNDQPKEGQP